MKSRWIMGKNCLKEVLALSQERIIQVLLSQRGSSLCALCKEKKISYRLVSEQTLTHLACSDSHQGCIAQVKEHSFPAVKTFLRELDALSSSLVLMCDGIMDPQNFGSILRAAECFGVDGVIWSKNRGVSLTPVVSKVSVGASELVPLIQVSNLFETLRLFQDKGYQVVATVSDKESPSLYSFSFSSRVLLIIGSEDRGIQPLLKKKADHLLRIPMRGKVESLNVAQAMTACLTVWAYQRLEACEIH